MAVCFVDWVHFEVKRQWQGDVFGFAVGHGYLRRGFDEMKVIFCDARFFANLGKKRVDWCLIGLDMSSWWRPDW